MKRESVKKKNTCLKYRCLKLTSLGRVQVGNSLLEEEHYLLRSCKARSIYLSKMIQSLIIIKRNFKLNRSRARLLILKYLRVLLKTSCLKELLNLWLSLSKIRKRKRLMIKLMISKRKSREGNRESWKKRKRKRRRRIE